MFDSYFLTSVQQALPGTWAVSGSLLTRATEDYDRLLELNESETAALRNKVRATASSVGETETNIQKACGMFVVYSVDLRLAFILTDTFVV